MTREHIEILRKCKLFENIKDDELSALMSCLNPHIQKYNRNDFVVMKGDNLDSIGIILEGEALVYKETLSGNRILIKNLRPGEMFGEVAVFARMKKWPAIVQASTSLTVCFISRDKIVGQCANVCKWHSQMTENMLGIISERASLLSKKLEYVAIKTMRSKLSTFLYEQYLNKGTNTFTIPMNREQLADFLNVSRPSMSRELSRMRDEGIIDFHLSTFKILDAEALKSYCE
ncbi:MAG: Crp/Fnr family transcriptional regulator [Clostridiaceae bacterium]|nr:Crp/Fnr family transcriptional regulator [Clostridiaceae bacterium]